MTMIIGVILPDPQKYTVELKSTGEAHAGLDGSLFIDYTTGVPETYYTLEVRWEALSEGEKDDVLLAWLDMQTLAGADFTGVDGLTGQAYPREAKDIRVEYDGDIDVNGELIWAASLYALVIADA